MGDRQEDTGTGDRLQIILRRPIVPPMFDKLTRRIQRMHAPYGWMLSRIRDGHGWRGPDIHKGERFTPNARQWRRWGTVESCRTAAEWHEYREPEYVAIPAPEPPPRRRRRR